MNKSSLGIKNIIFDLGRVIINIDVNKAFDKICQMSLHSKEENKSILHSINLAFEVGELNELSFIKEVKKQLQLNQLTDNEIIRLWNNVLLDIPTERIHLLQELAKKYRIFLLSNTNSTHLKGVNQILYETTEIENLSELFEKCYYSFEMKLRKPDSKIFETVIQENQLLPSETVFIDDTQENAVSASLLGIKSIYLCPPLTLKEALQDYV